MKKILFAVVVLMLVAPASAKVFITCANSPGDPNITIGYNCTEGEEVRCFGLDLQFDTDAAVVAVECLSDDYYVSPGQFSYDGQTPDFGTCDCTGKPGALPGPNGVTIEMCSLYADDDPDHNEAPQSSGDLVKLTVDAECCITITENSLRGGGVVLVDNTVLDEPNLPDPGACCVTGLDPYAGTCWGATDCPGQLVGDATCDGKVNVMDVLKVKQSWLKNFGEAGFNQCADFNRDCKVNVMDILKVKQNWLASGLGGNSTTVPPATCP